MTAVTKVSPCGRAVWEQVSLNKGWKVGKTIFLAYSHWFQAKQAGKLDIHKRVIIIYAADVKNMHNSDFVPIAWIIWDSQFFYDGYLIEFSKAVSHPFCSFV